VSLHARRCPREAFKLGILILGVVLLFSCGKPPGSGISGGQAVPVNSNLTSARSHSSYQTLQTAPQDPPPDPTSIKFDHLSIDDGLSSNTVYCVVQDRLGFLWIGTMDGLNRYDGYEIKVYRHDPIDPETLSSNAIYALHEDSHGDLWVGTSDKGLNRFDRQQGRFIRYQHDPEDLNSISNDIIYWIHEDTSGELWIATWGGGLNRYDRQNDSFIHYRHDPNDPTSLSSDHVPYIYEDRSGTLWVATTGGLNRFDRQNDSFTRFEHNPADPFSISASTVTSIVEDRYGALWIGTRGGGLNRLDRATGKFTRFQHDPEDDQSLSYDDVFFLLEDSQGLLWIGTMGSGVDLYDHQQNDFIHYNHQNDDPGSISNDYINSIYEDQAGTVWFATTDELSKFDRHQVKFLHQPVLSTQYPPLAYQEVWSLYEDSQAGLWVGTEEGLSYIDPQSGDIHQYQHDSSDPASLSPGGVTAIHEDSQGGIWVGSSSNGISRFNRSQAAFIHYERSVNNPLLFREDHINTIYQDRSGMLWFGTTSGLTRYDPHEDEYQHFYISNDSTDRLTKDNISTILEDGQGLLWIGTRGNGLLHFDHQNGSFHQVMPVSAAEQGISAVSIYSLHEDSQARLWVGTEGSGLLLYDRQTTSFHAFDKAYGLNGENIYWILEDQNGDLWLSTESGVSRFALDNDALESDTPAARIENYDISNEQNRNEFRNTGLVRQTGEILLGGAGGVLAFHPDQVFPNTYAPPIVLTSLRVNGEELHPNGSAELLEEIYLKWPNTDFEFEFAALSFTHPEKNRYAYMLEGYDQDWIEAGNRRFGQYTNLSGGSYILHLKGSNNEGVWNESGLAIPIQVTPPIWQTWGFRGLVALLVVGIAISGYRLRVRNIEASRRVLEKQVYSRTRELSVLNAISTAVSQSLDLSETLNEALQKTLELMEMDSGGIYLLDHESGLLSIAAHYGLSETFKEEIDHLQPGEGFSGHVVTSGQPLVVKDIFEDPRLTRQAVIEEGLRSLAVVPLNTKGTTLGTLFAVTHSLREFEERDLQLLTSIGNQIGVAVENARLYEETRNKLAQLAALQDTNRAVVSTLELDALLNLIIQQATTLLKADGGILNLADWDNMQDEVVACTGSTDNILGERGALDSSLSGWVTIHNQPIILNDPRADARVDKRIWTLLPEVSLNNTALAPLSVKDKVFGTLVVVDKLGGKGDFDHSDLDLLVAFANQAATAIENARLYTGERRRAEQFRLIAEMGRQLTLTLDIDELLTKLVNGVQQAFGYYHVGVGLVEGDEVVYRVGAGELWAATDFEFKPARLKIGKEGLTGWVAATGKYLLIPDVSEEPRFVRMEGSQCRSELTIPISVKDQVIGVLDAQSDRLNAFDETDVVVLQTLAHQAGAALENARLFNEEQRSAEQFRVINEVGRQITSQLNVDQLLAEMAHLLQGAFDFYHVGIGLIEDGEVVSKAEAGPFAEVYAGARIPLGQGAWGWVAQHGEPLITPDVRTDARFFHTAGSDQIRSHLCVPLKIKDEIIGVISAGSDRLNAFDESDQMILQSLAFQAAVAVENIRYYQRAQKVAVMEERSRLARDLHDAVTQTLFSASLLAEALPGAWKNNPQEGQALLQDLRSLSRGALAEMRTLLLELRPAALVETHLEDLLKQLAEAASGREGIPVEVYIEGSHIPQEGEGLPTDVHIALYRIAQEALNNVVKHARASQAVVRLCYSCVEADEPNRKPRLSVLLTVSDNGRGFDKSQAAHDRLGIGIMNERAQAIGAALNIESQPGEGAQVAVLWEQNKEE
jgi:GAF domain-containing protein/ligand-binding sensor domain-containing protein/two-component sensor histidine kinase